jgi:hypothetical protein
MVAGSDLFLPGRLVRTRDRHPRSELEPAPNIDRLAVLQTPDQRRLEPVGGVGQPLERHLLPEIARELPLQLRDVPKRRFGFPRALSFGDCRQIIVQRRRPFG